MPVSHLISFKEEILNPAEKQAHSLVRLCDGIPQSKQQYDILFT